MNVASLPSRHKVDAQKLIFHRNYTTALSAADEANIAETAKQILREQPRLDRVPPFGSLCSRGFTDAPSLLIEDHSGIHLAHERGADRNLSYRAAMLATDGDLLAVYGGRDFEFEAYYRDYLGLGKVTVMAPPITDPFSSLSQCCLDHEPLIAKAAGIAKEAGALNVLPYMANGGAWRLAKAVADRAGVPVHVAGPGPTLTRAVNDKLWFAHCATLLLGRQAVPENKTVYGMAALVGHLRRFVEKHKVVGIKLPHSAASLGNMVLESAEIVDLPAAAMAEQLAEAISQRGWDHPFPLQLTAWEGPLLGSPSVQLWIPGPDEGGPIIEAIFDQATSGSIARFVGGEPSRLGDRLKKQLASEADRLGTLFQRLGYFGRCSFDAVVVGDTETCAKIHWVECNGRWGGMSLPMTLANRLIGNWQTHGFWVFSHYDPEGVPSTVGQLLEHCEDMMFRQDRMSGVVLLTPGRLAYGGVDFLAIAEDQAKARQLGEKARARLSGPS